MGVSGVREDIDDAARLRTRPESHVTDIRLVDTSAYDDVRTTRRLGLEVAGATATVTGRFEALVQEWKRRDGSRSRFPGAYLEVGHFITGQPFRYRDGKFVRPRLNRTEAAWEVAGRLSWLDLNDGEVQGGEERNAGLALNVLPEAGPARPGQPDPGELRPARRRRLAVAGAGAVQLVKARARLST